MIARLIHRFSAVLLAALCGQAAAFPDKPVTIVVPFPPGGSSDIVARAITPKLTELLGQPVIIDNRAGANGSIGATRAARAAPDGYTIMVGSIGVLSVNPVLYKKLQYDTRRDFDLMTMAVRTPNVLVVHPDFPARTIAEFLAYMKANPDRVSFGAAGTGSSDHLTAALFMQKTGLKGVNVSFAGSGPLLNSLLGGHVNASFRNLGEIVAHLKAGKLRILATVTDRRLQEYPDVPTLAEAGVDGVQVFSWQGIAAPKGIPKDRLDKLQSAVIAALKDPAVTRNLNTQGFDVIANPSAEFTAFVYSELDRWKSTIDASAITVD